ncbi:hypothetical protein AMJ49_00865 [Parcubacteria bacterium DG_74_2]|nr:MAG: hypothetical protein AMJ49_00865 [Parcubacteria bacterium DG_74_2]
MKNFFSFFFEIFKIAILALLIVLPIRYFVFQPFVVKGASMDPNFSEGDYLIIDELSYRFREPERGEVIVFKYPLSPSQRFIKRIIGLPGETIEMEDNKITILNEGKNEVLDESSYLLSNNFKKGKLKISLKEEEYFVLGDNRNASLDSRNFGLLPQKYIIGRVLFRLWPITNLKKFEAPAYVK